VSELTTRSRPVLAQKHLPKSSTMPSPASDKESLPPGKPRNSVQEARNAPGHIQDKAKDGQDK
jgi:hypothetical protein